MKTHYTDKGFFYTNPAAYDERINTPIEKYIDDLWRPILLDYLEKEIKDGMIVADLGCGTFLHTQHMGKAGHIYAVDINQGMLDHGKSKIEKIKNKVTVLCESGTKTSIPDQSCDLVWIDGLSEFLNLDELFTEVKRITKPNAKFIILYQNKIHPENILVSFYYWLKKRSGKQYRSLYTFKKAAQKYDFILENFQSTALFFYLPTSIQKYFIWLWRVLNSLYQPLQKFIPIGNNIICEFRKNN
jgi:ubiquinone/menaquinone biosynthesis C-methylase UbiE